MWQLWRTCGPFEVHQSMMSQGKVCGLFYHPMQRLLSKIKMKVFMIKSFINGWRSILNTDISYQKIRKFYRKKRLLKAFRTKLEIDGFQNAVNGIALTSYLRGCWMWVTGLWFGRTTDAAGLLAWATWLPSIVMVFWLGDDDNCTLVSIGLFWLKPMISTGSALAARSELWVLCWTILIPPAFTKIAIKEEEFFLR